jgi:RNA polymerase sigma-70 factor, ECF subfamily
MLEAIEAAPAAGSIANQEGWLFRVAHNAALDFLRRRAGEQDRRSAEEPEMIANGSEACSRSSDHGGHPQDLHEVAGVPA